MFGSGQHGAMFCRVPCGEALNPMRVLTQFSQGLSEEARGSPNKNETKSGPQLTPWKGPQQEGTAESKEQVTWFW